MCTVLCYLKKRNMNKHGKNQGKYHLDWACVPALIKGWETFWL